MPKFSNKRFDKKEKRGSARSEARDRGQGKRTDTGFELFETTCDKCGKNCDVPFKPTQGKPIYCRACFRGTTPEESGRAPARGNERFGRDRPDRFESRGRDRLDSRDRPNFEKSDNLDEINKKLDKIMKALKIN